MGNKKKSKANAKKNRQGHPAGTPPTGLVRRTATIEKQRPGRGAGGSNGTAAKGAGRGRGVAIKKGKKGSPLCVVVEQVPDEGIVRHQEIPKAHDAAIMAIVMTSDAVYSASLDKKLKRWKPQPSQKEPGRFELQAEVEIPVPDTCWCLHSAGEWLFAGLGNGKIVGWSKSGASTTLSESCHKKRVSALLTHEHVLMSGGADNTVRMWQASPGGPQPFICTHSVSEGIPGAVQHMSVLGSNLWVGGTTGVSLVNLTNLQAAKQLQPKKLVAGFLQFEGHMIVAYADGSCCIFDAEGNRKMQQNPLSPGPVHCMAGLDSGPRVLLGHSKGQVSCVGLPMFDFKLWWQAYAKCKVASMACAGHDGIFLLGGESGSLQLWQRVAVPAPGVTA